MPILGCGRGRYFGYSAVGLVIEQELIAFRLESFGFGFDGLSGGFGGLFVFGLSWSAFIKLLDEGVCDGSIWETCSCEGGEKSVW